LSSSMNSWTDFEQSLLRRAARLLATGARRQQHPACNRLPNRCDQKTPITQLLWLFVGFPGWLRGRSGLIDKPVQNTQVRGNRGFGFRTEILEDCLRFISRTNGLLADIVDLERAVQ